MRNAYAYSGNPQSLSILYAHCSAEKRYENELSDKLKELTPIPVVLHVFCPSDFKDQKTSIEKNNLEKWPIEFTKKYIGELLQKELINIFLASSPIIEKLSIKSEECVSINLGDDPFMQLDKFSESMDKYFITIFNIPKKSEFEKTLSEIRIIIFISIKEKLTRKLEIAKKEEKVLQIDILNEHLNKLNVKFCKN